MDDTRVHRTADSADETEAIRSFLKGLWEGRNVIAACTFAVVVLAVAWTYLQPSIYTARTTLLPQAEESKSSLLSQVASFTGFSLDSEGGLEQLYQRIVHSDRLLDGLIDGEWMSPDGDRADLFEVFGVDRDGVSEAESRAELRSVLRETAIVFSRENRTGFMALKASVPERPWLAADLANETVSLLDRFNKIHRSSKATEQRTFIEERLAVNRESLDQASRNLTEFLDANRNYESSPSLTRIYMDLQREVEAETAVWVELRRQYELARIDENKQLGTISVLDEAGIPTRRSSPVRAEAALAGMILGFLLGIIVAMIGRNRRMRAAG